jgi:hypothetical protein
VETFWLHNVTISEQPFSAREEGGFLCGVSLFTVSVYEDAQIGNIPLTIPHFNTILTKHLPIHNQEIFLDGKVYNLV